MDEKKMSSSLSVITLAVVAIVALIGFSASLISYSKQNSTVRTRIRNK
jgi:hypothetical protein